MTRLSTILIPGLLALLLAGPALADFQLDGVIDAERVDDPLLGAWKYTLTITWNTGTAYGMSHVNLMIDPGDACTCATIDNGLSFEPVNGDLDGDCLMDVMTELNCSGDPSLGLEGILLKFEPIELEGCEAGVSGTMTIVFYSDHRPAPIDTPNLALSDKFGQLSGFGSVSGQFPALPCDTIPAESVTWGGLKAIYR